MKGFTINLEEATLSNKYFRKVLYTAKHSQLVLMSIKPGEDIGEEIHQLDQFIRCEAGEGKSIIDGIEHQLRDGHVVIIPSGSLHNIVNTSKTEDLKLYTVYSPANHRDGIIHETREDAMKDEEEHFDGKTSE